MNKSVTQLGFWSSLAVTALTALFFASLAAAGLVMAWFRKEGKIWK